MQRHHTIICTLGLLVGLGACAPAGALAAAPLLSGYGGPGAGAQVIVGAALLNGPAGGSGGGGSVGSGGAVGSSATSGSLTGVNGVAARSTERGSAQGTHSATGQQEHAGRGHARPGSTPATGVATSTHPRAAGATPNSSQLGGSQAVSTETEAAWFPGTDLLALVLVAGALAIIALATVRLARTEHH